ncbi:hypothetical protein IE077_003209 [Cardiosporidium cionae]|uniref:Macrophage erythroblast attacher n=1 Tax=Cardiosporidium cionae TaxID=476202 RepID=A0ABQ7J8U9_9APIC|nr:hypothetical protein IE077_003209 [Cardiosporidium cionae]|eukprot:KAF8820407.1 hypothetical protein IE077_003209 [Cardiosporidium cionae]
MQPSSEPSTSSPESIGATSQGAETSSSFSPAFTASLNFLVSPSTGAILASHERELQVDLSVSPLLSHAHPGVDLLPGSPISRDIFVPSPLLRVNPAREGSASVPSSVPLLTEAPRHGHLSEANAAPASTFISNTTSNNQKCASESSLSALHSKNELLAPLIDYTFIKIPFEGNVRTFRTFQRQIEKEIAVICNFLEKKILQESDKAVLLAKLDKVTEKLETIHKKADRSMMESEAFLEHCVTRLSIIKNEPDIQLEHRKNDFKFADYNIRLAWILHEYFARRGFTKTAEALIEEEGLHGLVDPSTYDACLSILLSLRRHETQPALDWCVAHKTRLMKMESTLEIQLRLQHIVGLISGKNYAEAIDYIRKNLTSEDFEKCQELKRAMALLALRNDPPIKYSDLFTGARWLHLEKQFEDVCSKLYSFTRKPTIELLLQARSAGISALKSQACRENKCVSLNAFASQNINLVGFLGVANCPACIPEWESYVNSLPSPHRVQSCLICPLSGEVMDSDNPPLVSPDGRVYSQNALKAIAASSIDGTILCPVTKRNYTLDKFKKIFVT